MLLFLENLEREGVTDHEASHIDDMSNMVKMTVLIKDKTPDEIISYIKMELQSQKRPAILKRLIQSYNSKTSKMRLEELEEWLTKNQ